MNGNRKTDKLMKDRLTDNLMKHFCVHVCVFVRERESEGEWLRPLQQLIFPVHVGVCLCLSGRITREIIMQWGASVATVCRRVSEGGAGGTPRSQFHAVQEILKESRERGRLCKSNVV